MRGGDGAALDLHCHLYKWHTQATGAEVLHLVVSLEDLELDGVVVAKSTGHGGWLVCELFPVIAGGNTSHPRAPLLSVYSPCIRYGLNGPLR